MPVVSAWGLPQARKRVLVVANRLGLEFRYPEHTHSWQTGRRGSRSGVLTSCAVDALAGLPAGLVEWTQTAEYQEDIESPWATAMRGDECTVHHHTAMTRATAAMAVLEPGKGMSSLDERYHPAGWLRRANRRVSDGMPSASRGGAPMGIRRLHPHHASPTITGSAARELVHPLYARPLSLRECARLQGFPDHWRFSGGKSSVGQQIGTAFPPPIACIIAKAILEAHGRAGSGGIRGVEPGLTGTNIGSPGASPALRLFLDRLADF